MKESFVGCLSNVLQVESSRPKRTWDVSTPLHLSH